MPHWDEVELIRKLYELNAYVSHDYANFYSRESEKLDQAARWYLNRYNISSAFKLYSPIATLLIKILIMGIMSFTLIEFAILFKNQWQTRINDILLIAVVSGFLIFSGIFLISLAKSLLLGIATYIREKYNRGIIWTITQIKYRHNRVSGRIIGFFMPKLLMAIFSGWIILLTAEEIWKSVFDFEIREALIVAFILLFFISIFVMLEIQKIKPRLTPGNVFTRTIVLMAFGIFYSNVIGIIAISFTSERMLVRSDYLPSYFQSVIGDKNHDYPDLSNIHPDTLKRLIDNKTLMPLNDNLFIYLESLKTDGNNENSLVYKPSTLLPFLDPIRIFPGMLVINTILALFIGVFLQMIFDRRNIAEPI